MKYLTVENVMASGPCLKYTEEKVDAILNINGDQIQSVLTDESIPIMDRVWFMKNNVGVFSPEEMIHICEHLVKRVNEIVAYEYPEKNDWSPYLEDIMRDLKREHSDILTWGPEFFSGKLRGLDHLIYYATLALDCLMKDKMKEICPQAASMASMHWIKELFLAATSHFKYETENKQLEALGESLLFERAGFNF